MVTFGAATTNNIIQGNLIGTNVDGTAALANGRHGVYVLQSGSGNTIGGTAAGARNVISGNTQSGVLTRPGNRRGLAWARERAESSAEGD